MLHCPLDQWVIRDDIDRKPGASEISQPVLDGFYLNCVEWDEGGLATSILAKVLSGGENDYSATSATRRATHGADSHSLQYT